MDNNTIAGFRLSTEQERVWGQQQQLSTAYIARCAVLLEGPLHHSALKKCLSRIVSEHEVLRTVFHRQPGLKVPFQVILDKSEPAWNVIDLSRIDTPAQTENIDTLMQQEARFDLQQGPLLQATLAVLSAEQHILVLSLPAMLADSRTLKNLVSELGRAYFANLSAQERDSEVMQYVDIVQWQMDLLQSDEAKVCRDFWRDYFRKIDLTSLSSATLPFETKASPLDFRPRILSAEVRPEILNQLDTICSQKAASPPDLLLACWATLLGRLTGQTGIVVGCGYDGRKYEELEEALGLFAKYIPLQITVESRLSFADVLRQTATTSAEAAQWQEGFVWPQIDSASDSTGTILPLAFEYMETGGKLAFDKLSITMVRQDVCLERYKLKLSVARSTSGLKLEFHYDSSQLEIDAINRIAGYFQTLLAAALEHPETPVGLLPLLSEAESLQMLVQWNQTAASYPKHECIHQLFEAQALRTPDRPAVRCNDQVLSYRELNEQSNQLAHYLRSFGVGSDSLVGLCLERSTGLIVALLGILKAGGAYVPLNADNPKPRLAQQLDEAVVLITEQNLLTHMPEFAGKTICLDSQKTLWSNQPCKNLELQTSPDNLVYVLYTSGSTGVPKGVAVRHRNLVNYSHFITKRLHLDQHPDGLQFATVSTIAADLGNTCIYPALISGGCLHLISYEVATDPQHLGHYTAQHPIDVLKIVPSHLQALLQAPEAHQVLPRQYLITGGEALSPKLIKTIMEFNPSCAVLNHYGPTETTVGSLTLLLSEYDWEKAATTSIPIGKPIANTQVYVLDAQQQPVPVGVVGELYIAGDGVTAGYLNDPDRTAERFQPNPFSDDLSVRMYRTGDLVRYLADGNIEFVGRADDQVKIRGFRIELGEIEDVLSKHSNVKQTVVLARNNDADEKRLLAYIVPRHDPAPSTEELRTFLKQQLPDYMVPAAIILLPKLPLTANGKLDRQALPEPEVAESSAYVAPHTPTEEVVAGIWAEVLRRDRISTQDNFFDVGGHSLLATQVISRIRRMLNVDLALRTLFESPTVAGIAQQIDNSRRDPLVADIPPIVEVSRDQDLPLSFAQQRLWVLDQMEPNNPLYNIPRRVRLRGELNVEALTKALNEIVQRHESQRTTFAVKNGAPVQVIAPTLDLDVALHSLIDLTEDDRLAEARRIATEEALIPFDLTTGPLLRATLLKLAPDDHILLLTMHHIVSDAWSAGIFFQEFSALYESFSSRQASKLPQLTVQYADYASWQRKWFQGNVLDRQLAYWREQLKGAPLVLQLPSDRPRSKAQSFHGSHETITFSAELSRSLKKLGQQEGATLFMSLLAGFQTLLSRYSGQEQIVIGTDVANRTTTDTERMIGFFINLLAMRTDLSGNPTFREVLGRVRESALGAYAHQDMPFDKLVEELQPERSLSHNPLVQVLFVMQNIPRQKREIAGLTLEPFELPITRSKFDLAVFMVDGEDELVSHWLYSTDLFNKSTIQRMAKHFETLLTSAINQPDARLSMLEMLSYEEKQQQDANRKQKKQTQLKKLMTAEPKSVTFQ
jgi:amino acid adenylation domain-containing protein